MAASPLQLPGLMHVAPTADELYDDLGLTLMAAATKAVGQHGVFHLALSGGSTPEPFYVRLVTDPRFRAIPWKDSHLWMVDERRVPETDAKSNFRMIRETLADHVPIRKRNVHPMPVLESDPATLYETELAEAFGIQAPKRGGRDAGSTPSLNFVLLGMGEDGHTASLFPGSAALDERGRWIAPNDGPGVVPPPRVTMTFPLLNAARKVVVLLTGEKKAASLRRVSEQWRDKRPRPNELPITGVQPESGELLWYLDAAAAGET